MCPLEQVKHLQSFSKGDVSLTKHLSRRFKIPIPFSFDLDAGLVSVTDFDSIFRRFDTLSLFSQCEDFSLIVLFANKKIRQ